MDSRSRVVVGLLVLAFLFTVASAHSFSPFDGIQRSAFQVVSDLKEPLAKKLGLKTEELTIVDYDFWDAVVGRSVAHEFDLEIGRKVLPFKVMEDVKEWMSVDPSLFSSSSGFMDTVLVPFDLSGPMELWIQDGENMRLSLPHDVDAGLVKKVILLDGATVTVQGAKAVVLRQPIDIPLSNVSISSFAHHLRHASLAQQQHLVSLRIVGPSSLTVSSMAPSDADAAHVSSAAANRLKVKRLAPGLLQLSSSSQPDRSPATAMETASPETTAMVPVEMWPFSSLNVSNRKLAAIEEILKNAVLAGKVSGSPASSVRLTHAETSVQTFMKIEFGLERRLNQTDEALWEGFPEWRTKPSVVRLYFEVMARLEGEKLTPEMIKQVQPFVIADSSSHSALFGNFTTASVPLVMFPPSVFTL
ncbi:hypothetical protein EJ110_NYTH56410 [Nymphaea thermarum]|nr:hypothetical protein EJ110_NYTH56410 [Nymphaea thermarum]